MASQDLQTFRMILSGFFLIAGIVLAVVTPVIRKRQKTWPKAEGEISSIKHRKGSDHVAVLVTYETEEGIPYTTELGYYQSGFQVGQKLRLCYDPQNPQHVVADTDALVALTVCLSVLFLFVGVILWLVMGAAIRHRGF